MSKRQEGYVALALVLALVIGTMAAIALLLARHQAPTSIEQQARSIQILNVAKAALIAHAAADSNTPGALGRQLDAGGTELTDEQASQDSDEPRRLGTASLGLQPAANTQDECLWYALSPSFRDGLSNAYKDASKFTQLPLNIGNFGSIRVRDSDDPQAPSRLVIAILIDPGPALAGQNRSSAGGNGCHGGNWSDFLESWDDQSRSFVLSRLSGDFNDRIVTIDRNELFKPILRRVLQTFASDAAQSSGLRWYLAQHGKNLADLVDVGHSATGEKPGSRLLHDTSVACIDADDNPMPCFDQQFAPLNPLPRLVPSGTMGCPSEETIVRDNEGNVIRDKDGNPKKQYSAAHVASWLCYNDWYSYLEYKIDNKDDGCPTNDEATLSLVLDRNTPTAYGCSLRIEAVRSPLLPICPRPPSPSTKADTISCGNVQ